MYSGATFSTETLSPDLSFSIRRNATLGAYWNRTLSIVTTERRTRIFATNVEVHVAGKAILSRDEIEPKYDLVSCFGLYVM